MINKAEILNQAISNLDNDFVNAYPYGPDDNSIFILIDSTEDAYKLDEEIKKLLAEAGEDTSNIPKYGCLDMTADLWGYTDEYFLCDSCLKVWPLYTNGLASYSIIDNCIYCSECIRDNPNGYIETLINNPNRANTMLTDKEIEACGFKKYNESGYAAGYYDRHDEPKAIYKHIKEENPELIVLFSITSAMPFETEYDVWVK